MDVEVNDQTWFKLMLPTFIWFAFCLGSAVMNITGMGYLAYSTILLFCSSGFIVYSIIRKDLQYYKIGFWLYCSYTGICIIYDFLALAFLWFFFKLYMMMVGAAFQIVKIAEKDKDENLDESIKTATDALGWAFFGLKCLFTFVIVLSALIDLCFLCHLRGKIKLFIKYNENKQGSNPQLLSS